MICISRVEQVHSKCRVFLVGLICACISNVYADTPYGYGQQDYKERNSVTNYRESYDREQVNPWAIQPRVKRNVYSPPPQRQHNPIPAESSGPRFISEEELDALNASSYYHGVIDSADNSAADPQYDQDRRSTTYDTSPYARKDPDRTNRPGEEFDRYQKNVSEQRRQNITRPPVYRRDRVDSDQFDAPFAVPFGGADRFRRE